VKTIVVNGCEVEIVGLPTLEDAAARFFSSAPSPAKKATMAACTASVVERPRRRRSHAHPSDAREEMAAA